MDIFEKCRRYTRVEEIQAKGVWPYFMPLASAQGPEITVGKHRLVMMGSNNYLGLADNPKMKQASQDAVARWGTGCAGSRFLNGTLELHEATEKKLARFKHREAALIFSTGYQTNLGVISCLVGRNDVIIVDKWDHASIMDGGRLSWGDTLRYRHNDMEHLDQVLRKIPKGKGKLLVVDGVFSMEGDIARLPEIARLARAHGARLLVDDAHSTGVLGAGGRGTCEYYGLENGEIDLIVGTCSKAFGSVGGFVVGSEKIISYIKYTSRSMMFSAALPAASVAAISTAIDFMEKDPQRRQRLWKNAERFRSGLNSLGFDTGITETPIVPIVVGDDYEAFNFWKLLFNDGLFTNPVVTPAVLPGRALIRNTPMATHTDEQIDRALEILERCGRKIGLLSRSGRRRIPVSA